jgi:competence protein ComEC
MLKWVPYALVRVAAFFIAGVLLGIYWPTIISESLAITLFIGFALLFSVSFFILEKSPHLPLVSGSIGLCSIFIAGFINLLQHTETRKPDHLIHTAQPIEVYRAKVKGAPEEKTKSWKLEVEVNSVKLATGWQPVS